MMLAALRSPVPSNRFARYYLAHDSQAATKGVYYEHAAPAAAFVTLQLNPQVGDEGGNDDPPARMTSAS